ncbi:MAG: hypothetical protein IPJ32_04680 [Sphingobacteriaceae bacterium]|nr:hypothetical protein [Sphingobacteriaceae bacterium]
MNIKDTNKIFTESLNQEIEKLSETSTSEALTEKTSPSFRIMFFLINKGN